MSLKRIALALLSLGACMFAGAANAGSLACWTFEFVPEQHVPHPSLGEVQNGHTYYSDEFEWTDGVEQDGYAELFEAYVRKTVQPLGAGSLYVSGCSMSNATGTPKSNASRAHDRFFRESDGRSTNLHWTPSAADLLKAPPPLSSKPIYMQCLTVPSARFYNPGDYGKTPVFQVQLSESFAIEREAFRSYLEANKIEGAPRCLKARTRERLNALALDEIDHSSSGGRIFDIPFKPDGALAEQKTVPTPKPKPPVASTGGSLTIKTDTSLRDVGKAWDAQVKKALADEARKKVELAAKTAQADAKAKAEWEAFFMERRRQGRAQ